MLKNVGEGVGKLLEKNVEDELVRRVKDLGGECFKFISPGNSGVPDRIVILNSKVVFVELKRPNGKTRKLQDVQLRRLQGLGANVKVISSIDEVNSFIEEVRNGI